VRGLPGRAAIPGHRPDAETLGPPGGVQRAGARLACGMADESHAPIPLSIDAVVSRLGELEVVFGPAAGGAIQRVRTLLLEAMAARDRGDGAGVVAKVGEAMDGLVALAGRLDPAEAVLMRSVAEQFRTALLRRDTGTARQTADLMFERSGARWRKPGGGG